MKKFLIILLVFGVLSLLLVPCLADERVYPSFEMGTRATVRVEVLRFYSVVSYTHPSVSTTASGTGTVVIDGVTYSLKSLHLFPNGRVLAFKQNDDTLITLINADGTIVSGWDGVITFDTYGSLNVPFYEWYSSFPSASEVSVSDGVSSFISWVGNVLTQLVSSTYVLPLVGLAVALFCVLPFGITTIKNLMKGY